MKTILLICMLALSTACALPKKVARQAFAQPSPECVRRYACKRFQFCGPNAGLIVVGSTTGYSSDVTRGAFAAWAFPDPWYPDCH